MEFRAWHIDVFWFINLEAFQTPSFWLFGGFITEARLIKLLATVN